MRMFTVRNELAQGHA